MERTGRSRAVADAAGAAGAAECRVSGPLGWALLVSRLAGVAPLRFSAPRDGRGWYIRFSPAFDLYGKIITVTLCLLSAASLFMDLYVEPELSLVSNNVSSMIVYFTKITVMVAVVLAASFTGARRMACLLDCIARLQTINCDLNVYERSWSSERSKWLVLTLPLAWGLFTMTLDFGIFMKNLDVEYGRSAALISSIFIFTNLMYATQLVTRTQFSLVALTLLGTLRMLNDRLKDLLDQIRSEASSAEDLASNTSRNPLNLEKFKVSVKTINGIIDSLANMEKIKMETARSRSQPAAAVRRLARAHAAASGAMRRLDRSLGLVLLALMVSFLINLLITAYCLVRSFVTVFHSQPMQYDPSMQALWAVINVGSFLIVLEPAHQTQLEMGRTKTLVSQMMQSAAPRDAELVAELELFYRQVSLGQVAYAPMKMYTLNRGIIATMVGTITTYLVVVIQF